MSKGSLFKGINVLPGNIEQDASGHYVGVVYRYTLSLPGCAEDGFSYIGCTTKEARRRREWGNVNSCYGGKKISEARALYGLSAFVYDRIKRVRTKSLRYLLRRLSELEADFIRAFNSILRGFNTSSSGPGRQAIAIRATEPSGKIIEFQSASDAARHFHCKEASVLYWARRGGCCTSNGVLFEII